MKLTEELLIEFEECLNAINELVGIERSAMNEIADAVMTVRLMIELNKNN